MRILFRYVFREFLIPLGYCLAGFLGIYVLFELFGSYSRIVEAKLPFGTIVSYFAGYLSPYFLYLAPAALMLATLYTMWNFSRHSELTAMRASGVSLGAIVRPLLLVAVLLAALVAWVNESYAPTRALWAKRLRAAHFDAAEAESENVLTYKDTDRGHSWVAGGYDPDCRHLTDVRIVLADKATGSNRVLSAERADYLDGEWWISPPLRMVPELRERPGDLLMQSDGPQIASARGKLRYLRKNDDLTDLSRASLKYDAWAQILSPLACLVIVLLTIPAGVATGRQAVFKGVLATLGKFFAFHGAIIGCMVLAKTGSLPPVLAALAPYVLFGFFAVRTFRRSRTL